MGENQIHNPINKALSYADLVRGKKHLETTLVDLSSLPIPFIKEGKPAIQIPAEYFNEGCEIWRYSLIGRLDSTGLTFSEVKQNLLQQWKIEDNKVQFIPMNRGYFIIKLFSDEDKNRVLCDEAWIVKQQALRLIEWYPGFDANKKRTSHATVWVQFPGLPVELWFEKTLLSLAKSLGTPIAVDKRTLSHEFGYFAAVLIDIDFANHDADSINVSAGGREFWQAINIHKRPKFCSSCKIIGHEEDECRKNKKSKPQNGKIHDIQIEDSTGANSVVDPLEDTDAGAGGAPEKVDDGAGGALEQADDGAGGALEQVDAGAGGACLVGQMSPTTTVDVSNKNEKDTVSEKASIINTNALKTSAVNGTSVDKAKDKAWVNTDGREVAVELAKGTNENCLNKEKDSLNVVGEINSIGTTIKGSCARESNGASNHDGVSTGVKKDLRGAVIAGSNPRESANIQDVNSIKNREKHILTPNKFDVLQEESNTDEEYDTDEEADTDEESDTHEDIGENTRSRMTNHEVEVAKMIPEKLESSHSLDLAANSVPKLTKNEQEAFGTIKRLETKQKIFNNLIFRKEFVRQYTKARYRRRILS